MSKPLKPTEIKNLGMPNPGEPGWPHFVAAHIHQVWAMEEQLRYHYALEAAKRVQAQLSTEKKSSAGKPERLDATPVGFSPVGQPLSKTEIMQSTSCNTQKGSTSSATSTAMPGPFSTLLKLWAMKIAPVFGGILRGVRRSSSET